MFKRAISLLCAAVLALSLCPALAAETEFKIFVSGEEVPNAYAIL